MTTLRVVVAPDSFKGSASASEAARAVAAGWRSVRPQDDVVLLPMADGGEGTLDAFATAVPGARRMPVTVRGPQDATVAAHWLALPDGVGVVELAATSGITLMDGLSPTAAHTYGFGEAIADALRHGVRRLLLGLGGSASTDGGAGLLLALGARIEDEHGVPIPLGNVGLATAATVDLATAAAPPVDGALILSDVTNPLLGPLGAAPVFGPQKGADPATVEAMAANLERFAGLVGADPTTPGAGAAGGAGFGLLAWGAVACSGASTVGERLGVPEALRVADVVITGEGRYDSQSGAGKVPSYVLAEADGTTARPMLVAGLVEAPTTPFAAVASLSELAGDSAAAQADAGHWLEVAGARLATSC